jgi:hypothetical protein
MDKSILIIVTFIIIVVILSLINSESFEIYYNDTKHFMKSDWKHNFLLNNNMLSKPTEQINKFAIITYENRKDVEYITLHNKNMTEYCKKWNYDYLFYDQCIHNVYWCKMYLVLDALKTGKYDYVLWMDSDAIIKNSNISLDSIVNKYSSDIYVNFDNGKSVFCAGVFMIKNSPIGIAYLEECIKQNNKKCLTENNQLKGIWAGLCYEQGIMNELIFQKYYKYTTSLPRYLVLNRGITDTLETCDEDAFILHLYGSPNDARVKCFSRFVS